MEQAKDQLLDRKAGLTRASNYCARAERCISQVLDKLRLWYVDPLEHGNIIYDLVQAGYIDEVRYATMFARDKHRLSGWGMHRIKQELRARHIDSAIITQALEALEDEFDMGCKLSDLLERKWRSLPQSLDKRQAYDKLVRYAQYRGYSYAEIAPIAQRLLRHDPDDFIDE